MIEYSLYELIFYLLLYSLAGWGLEVAYAAVRNRQFVNRGFLNSPFVLSYGIAAVILMQTLPTLHHQLFFQLMITFIVFHIVWSFSEFFIKKICHLNEAETFNIPTLTWKSQLIFEAVVSVLMLMVLLIVHPFSVGLIRLLPKILIQLTAVLGVILLVVDLCSVLFALRAKTLTKGLQVRQSETRNLAEKISASIWKRLQKTYPGIQQSESVQKDYTFAKGICFDKLVWVFLISSFLGALIEMCYCRAAGDIWMNRSSLLYGSFSVVWGVGAVILTIVLKPIAKKADRYIFMAGFVVGGAYEYLCSVFTEIVFGTVFWDYSHMPLNIGGRTNVLYCIFWGLLAVVWVKVLYPPMEKAIEKLPPLHGKIITWIIVFVMALDGILTCGAMIRYTERKESTREANAVETFFDINYDDDWMEHRWPNMKITDSNE